MAEFTPEVRAAIYQAGDGRCIGCGATNLTAQHRRRRGMGGSRDPLISTPANGVPLCGHGTAGCHGWTEHHPTEAALMGWALTDGQDQLEEPFWTRFGWRLWTFEAEAAINMARTVRRPLGFYAVAFVDDHELDDYDARMGAVATYLIRADGWR